MSTFDLSFDRTFQTQFNGTGAPAVQAGCRRSGVYLTWLTVQGGWEYWLFEGHVRRSQSSASRGQAVQGGLINHTQKETASILLLHTAGVTEPDAIRIGTLWESISIYLLQHDDTTNAVERIRVTLPVGDAPLWNPETYTNNFSFALTLPSRRTQRL